MPANLSFIQDESMRNMVANGHEAVTQLELWEWLNTFEPIGGFMYSSHDNVIAIGNKMDALPNSPGHSGASFGVTMRHLQFIAKHGMDNYKKEMTK